ncbi:hypothetical protein [Nocardiopsis metallicus]|uniref:Lipoprotein n=1 Tax=Nocardiopsis metallicus TaxID=179819 RepID=A0A840W1L0_9ACTN|nr:hypothetical protein [Nocardiopsis metallicus]MBB5490679.1 hypothetical protein [Nocardiopsis metallicus]
MSTARSPLPLALVAVSLLTACGGVLGQADALPGRGEVIGVGDDPRVLVHDFNWAVEAMIIGELEYLPEPGCLIINLRDEATGETVGSAAPVWPKNVEPLMEEERGGVSEPTVGPILDGDPVYAGGGSVSGGPTWEVDLTGECVPGGEYIVLTEDSFQAEPFDLSSP